ncbi:hypothetical protein PIB30_017583 [Stylosanthes scabra]|uniref:Uncharacterized protein n=1 Tax=Stylosanthes scabra TaxID=79078 RepID=A0ABU6U6L2_9FABA|nr:hypothetical protein [Stylosanthes scabra]
MWPNNLNTIPGPVNMPMGTYPIYGNHNLGEDSTSFYSGTAPYTYTYGQDSTSFYSGAGGPKKVGVSKKSSLLKAFPESNHDEGQRRKDEVVSQVVKQAMLSSNARVQHNKGLINSNGNTSGFLNHCIIFMNYKLPNLD